MFQQIDRYFHITKRESTLSRELLAGLSLYLSLAYIFIINPAILSKSGLSVNAVLFATVIASGLSTLLMGLWAKMPFALAPGLEMNGFFAFVVCGTLGLTWQQALGAVFWSGVLCLILTALPARQSIIDSIPNPLKINIGCSVGVFVATIGLFLAKIISFKDGLPDVSAFATANLITTEAIALYIGLAISFLLGLPALRFPAGMLIAIIVAAVFCKMRGVVVENPPTLSSDMLSATFQLDWLAIFSSIKLVSVFLVLFLIDFYGSIGKFIGLTAATNLQKDGHVVNMGKAMYVDGIGTVGGALVGTSSIITYVESAIAITSGGRTGLVAVVCGSLMLLSLLFTPLVALVPVVATSGILLYVGYLLLPVKQMRDPEVKYSPFDLVVAAMMGAITLATFSLDKSMLLGFLIYSGRHLISRPKNVNWWLVGSTALLAISVIAQYTLK